MQRFLLHQALDQAAEHAPDHPSVRCHGEELSYSELVRQANGLARMLVEHGVRPGDCVGIYMQKGLRPAIALYGIMKAGAAYVPLDPSAPPARIANIVNSCQMPAIVTEETRREPLQQILQSVSTTTILGLDSPLESACDRRVVSWDEIDAMANDAAPAVVLTELDLAYVLHTSGSTGTPKGIMHTHRSGLSFAEVAVAAYGFTADDRISNHAPLHFDLSILDFFAAAVVGATTIIIPEAHAKFPASLSKLIADERMTVFYCVPFALIQLLLHGALDKRDLSSLRWVLFGGEPFPPNHLHELMQRLPGARFSNVYGPTEVNGCTFYEVPTETERSDEPIPIGRPFANVEALIVDAEDRAVPPGEIGELLIRSPTMMLGYWRDEPRNARAFYRRERTGGYTDVFHRTGDLVQERAGGELRFVGRKDRQVKVRGHRVELDEVEAALASHESVAEAGAYVLAGAGGITQIEVAATIRPESAIPPDTVLHLHLAALLPPYAMPSQIHVLDEFPRTATGKIDRRELKDRAEREAQSR